MVGAYISHRLQVAGATYDIFLPETAGLIHEATRGIPRLVNQLCDLSLVYAFTMAEKQVSRAIVQQVLNDGVFFGGGVTAQAPATFVRSAPREHG